MALSPEELAKAMGVTYTPGMSYADFNSQVMAKQGGPALMGPVSPPPGEDAPIKAPQTLQDFKAMAVANAAPPTQKKIALEGVPIQAPSGAQSAPQGASGGGGDDLGMSFKQFAAMAPKGSAGGWRDIRAPGVKEQEGRANAAQEQADQASTEANVNVQNQIASNKQGFAGVVEGARMQAAEAEQRRQNVIDQHAQEQAKLSKDVADFKVDPDDYYGQGAGGVLKRAFNIIAVSLGGYSAGLRGGPNTVQQSIDDDINRFVDAQKTELNKKQSLLQQSNTRFGQLEQQFGSQRAAEAAMKADLYAAAQSHAEGLVESAKSDVARANGQQLAAAYEDKKIKQMQEAQRLIPATAGPNLMQLAKEYQGLQKGAAELHKTHAETAKLEAQAAAGGGGSKKGLPPSVISQIGSIQSARQAIDAELKLMDNDQMPSDEKRRLSAANLSMLSLELPKAFTGGVPTHEEVEETKGNLPSKQGGFVQSAFNAIVPGRSDDAQRRAMLQAQLQMLHHKEAALRETANEARAVGSSGPEEQ